jgi:hypothetical protein
LRQFLRGYHPAGVQPDRYVGAFSTSQFYRHDLPRMVYENRRMFAGAAVVALASVLVGSFVARHQSGILAFDLSAPVPPADAGPFQTMVVLGDMLRSSLGSNLLGSVSFGLFALVGFAAFVMQFGYEASWYVMYPVPGMIWHTFARFVLWFPPSFVAVAFALRLGIAPLWTPHGFGVGQHILWALANFLKVYGLVVVPWFVVAATFEAWILPLCR